MTRAKNTTAYPSLMLTGLERAVDLGELVIPTAAPSALRLQYYGLIGALRHEGKTELADLVSFHIQHDPSALVIRLKDTAGIMQDLAAALGAPPQPSASEEAAAALDRILGGKS